MTKLSRQRGVALIVVLWMLLLVEVVAASQLLTARTEVQRLDREQALVRARGVSEAAVSMVMAELLRRGHAPFPSPWPLPDLKKLTIDGSQVDIAIESELGKIDLNGADLNALRQLLIDFGKSESDGQAIIDRIADWRDADDVRRPAGAENADYLAGHSPANRSFLAVDELQSVLGIDGATYALIAPYVTVATNARAADLRFAAERTVKAYEALGTKIDPQSPSAPDMTTGTSSLSGLKVRLVPGSYTIRCTAHVDGSQATTAAVVSLNGNPAKPFEILSWRRSG